MGKYIFLLTLFFSISVSVLAQSDSIEYDMITLPPNAVLEEEVVEDVVYKVVEVMPEFPGGQDSLMRFIGSIKYPKVARENDWEGTVYIQFVIGIEGAVQDVVVARSSGYSILDTASVNHIMKMPNWKPGIQRGKPVRVQYVVPIKFKLGNGESSTVFKVVEQMPEYPGGEKELKKFESSAPAPYGFSKKDIADKTVYVSAVIDDKGQVTKLTVAKGCGVQELDAAALSYIARSPVWNPGRQRGQKVNVEWVFKVSFIIPKI
jgi:TonB family protein